MGIIDSTGGMMFTAFEPKLQNRFLMSIDTGAGSIPGYLIKKIARPSVSFGEVVLDHINVKRKLKGKANWENINVELYDPVTPSGAQAVMEWIRLSHESVTGRDGYSDFYKKDILIKTLGPVGDIVEEWKLKGAYCQSANFNDLDFSSSDPVDISVTLRYDYAILEF